MRPGQGLRAPSMPREGGVDLSKMYSHPQETSKTPDMRRRRAVSEDRSVEVGIGWRGTGGRSIRSISRQSSKSNVSDLESFRFLPPDALNQEEPPKLILRKTPAGGSRVSLYGGDIDVDLDSGNKKKLSSGAQPGDISRRETELQELVLKLEIIQELIEKVENIAQQLLKKQTESEEFQSQMRKEQEGYDLQKGVYRVLESLDGDKREFSRLLKKVTEMQKRHSKGVFLDGENEELRSLALGINDLEKKLLRALDELERLENKTDSLIERQRALAEQRRKKMEEEALKNSALLLLLKDSSKIDQMLKELAIVKSKHLEAEQLQRKIHDKIQNVDEDEMDTDEIVLQRIGVDTESVTEDLLRVREDIIKLQDVAVCNPNNEDELDVVAESANIRQKLESNGENVNQLKIDIEDFLKNQAEKFAEIMKRIKEEEEEQRRKREKEELKKRQANDEEMRRLELLAEENRQRQKQDILHALDDNMNELNKMKDQVLILVDKQKRIKSVRRKRRELFTIPEEDENDFDIKDLTCRTNDLFSKLADNENKVLGIKAEIETKDNNDLVEDVKDVEDSIISQSMEIQKLTSETNEMLDDEQRKFNKAQASKDSDLHDQLKDCEKTVSSMLCTVETVLEKQKCVESIVGMLENDDVKQEYVSLHKETIDFNEDMKRVSEFLISLKNPSDEGMTNVKLASELQYFLSTLKPKQEALCIEKKTNQLLETAKICLHEKQLNDAESERKNLDNDQSKLSSLQQNVKDVAAKHEDMENQLKENCEDDEEKRRRLEELEKLMKQKLELSDLEKNLSNISEELEEWKEFQWSEEEELELNKYGMISSLSMPSFPAGLIKDPHLLAATNKRHQELIAIRKKILLEEQRMKEICDAIEEMEQRQREAELKRLAQQSKEWINDLVPRGSAMFGSEPSFKSDFHIDPEEARARAASRRASRMASRESSVTPLETLGASKGYEEELLGYTARSRQQSLDRRQGAEKEKKLPERKAQEQKVEVDDKIKKPPAPPRRKREK